jgi:hypothetical protein
MSLQAPRDADALRAYLSSGWVEDDSRARKKVAPIHLPDETAASVAETDREVWRAAWRDLWCQAWTDPNELPRATWLLLQALHTPETWQLLTLGDAAEAVAVALGRLDEIGAVTEGRRAREDVRLGKILLDSVLIAIVDRGIAGVDPRDARLKIQQAILRVVARSDPRLSPPDRLLHRLGQIAGRVAPSDALANVGLPRDRRPSISTLNTPMAEARGFSGRRRRLGGRSAR